VKDGVAVFTTRKMGDVIELISGQHIAAKDYNNDRAGLPYLTGPSDFGERHPIISRWTEHPKKCALRGDILITVKGSGVGSINVLDAERVAISRQLMAVRAKAAESRYLELFLSLHQEHFRQAASGAAIPGLSREDVLNLPIPLPPLEEQRRIVAKLDQAFTVLDRARAHAEANLADAGELFDSWLQTTFEDGSEDWPSKTLSNVCENLDRARVPITKKDREPGEVPYYGASGVVDHVANHIFDEDLLLISEDGANLLARTYPIAFSISGKSWVNNHAHVLKFEDLDSQEFVRLYMNSISLEPFVSGMAQPKLNQAQLNRIPIPFPDVETQRVIVSKANAVWVKSQEAKAHYEAQLIDLADLRQSLLQQAFSGQL
jgi:type I restriction enzyme S subunit